MDHYFIVSGQHEVTLRSNSPTAAAIEAALQSISYASGGEDVGSFVGSARIVRRAYFLPPGGRITTFSWLWKLPDNPAKPRSVAENAARATNLAGNLQAQVSQVLVRRLDHGVFSSDWSNVAVTPYDPTSNGTIAWWASGEASHTPTRDEFALNQQAGQMEQVDAPAGPTGARPTSVPVPHVPTLPTLPSSSDLKVFGGLTLGILGLWYIGPVIKAASRPKLRKVEYARRNPIGPVRASLLRKGERVEWHPSSEKEASRFEGLLRIGESGVMLENGARGGFAHVRFDGGTIVPRMPIRELGIRSEMGFARPNPPLDVAPRAARRPNPSLDVAETILRQMGGAGRLKAMIGAKDFVGGEYSLTFKWTAPSVNKANALTVTLTTDDTYNMAFMSLRGRVVKVVKAVEGAYAEDLARIFRIETGLALSL